MERPPRDGDRPAIRSIRRLPLRECEGCGPGPQPPIRGPPVPHGLRPYPSGSARPRGLAFVPPRRLRRRPRLLRTARPAPVRAAARCRVKRLRRAGRSGAARPPPASRPRSGVSALASLAGAGPPPPPPPCPGWWGRACPAGASPLRRVSARPLFPPASVPRGCCVAGGGSGGGPLRGFGPGGLRPGPPGGLRPPFPVPGAPGFCGCCPRFSGGAVPCRWGSPLRPPAPPSPLGTPGCVRPILGASPPLWVTLLAPLSRAPRALRARPGAAFSARLSILKLSTGVLTSGPVRGILGS
jgi:hypothetical protein